MRPFMITLMKQKREDFWTDYRSIESAKVILEPILSDIKWGEYEVQPKYGRLHIHGVVTTSAMMRMIERRVMPKTKAEGVQMITTFTNPEQSDRQYQGMIRYTRKKPFDETIVEYERFPLAKANHIS